MTDALLEIRDARIGFGDGPDVVAATDLVIRAAEFVSVIGPSGCGKSTILNAAAGLQPLRSGSITYADVPVRGVNTAVGYMTQGDTLLPWRNVEDNVALPLRLRGSSRAAARERAHEVLELLDLRDAARQFPAQLSGGMKRRALLGRSLIYEPELLLMDEPFAALDAQLRTQMHAELRSSIARTSQAVLFVTHDIDEAVLLSDRVVVLGGRPAAPMADIEIDLGPERDVDSLRFESRFVDLVRSVHDALSRARAPRVMS